jgi:hypothetical protein
LVKRYRAFADRTVVAIIARYGTGRELPSNTRIATTDYRERMLVDDHPGLVTATF